MAKLTTDPVEQVENDRFHPLRVTFQLPQPVIRKGWRVYDSPASAAGHPRVAALFQVRGIQVVTLHRNEVKILRDPEIGWEEILPAAKDVLRREFLGQEPLEAA